MSSEEAEFGLNQVSVSNTIIGGNCPAPPVCEETKYRTIDGSCNNLANKEWGQAATAFQRLLPPKYADGKSFANKDRGSLITLMCDVLEIYRLNTEWEWLFADAGITYIEDDQIMFFFLLF